MSWSRFGSSALYTYEDVERGFVCAACSLMPGFDSFTTGDLETFLLHVDHHPDAPVDLAERIRADYEGARA